MSDRTIAVHTAISCILWPSAFVLVCLGIFTGHNLGQLGLLFGVVAATLTVRGWICELGRREREAYEIGRESVRSIR